MSRVATVLHNEACAQVLFARVPGGVAHWRAQRRFGGVGLEGEHGLFCIVCDGRMFARVDELSRLRHERAGLRALQPYGGRALRDFFEVPAAVLADGAQLQRVLEQSAALPLRQVIA